jgi:hypothetical protein
MSGNFIISLDFELHWGGIELWDLKEKQEYFLTTRKVIPDILKLFVQNNIHATWATVGFLFAKNIETLENYFPKTQPNYHNSALNYYQLFTNKQVGENEIEDPFHFGNSIIQEIVKSKNQELASHTFCHYYCNEEGQTKSQFDADLAAAQSIALKETNQHLTSLVFPRNQYNNDYLETVLKNGFSVVRSNPNVWFWKSDNRWLFLARAFDTLFPISKTLCFSEQEIEYYKELTILPASRFFRPYSQKEKIIQKLKLCRIKREMLYAAKNNLNYHLWWHPHNFGNFPKENLEQLEEILAYFQLLNKKYNFTSKKMSDFKKI